MSWSLNNCNLLIHGSQDIDFNLLSLELEVEHEAKYQVNGTTCYHRSFIFFDLIMMFTVMSKTSVLLLAIIALSAAQSSAQTFIHNTIMFIDISNNAWYNKAHWLIGTPYLSSNVKKSCTHLAILRNKRTQTHATVNAVYLLPGHDKLK